MSGMRFTPKGYGGQRRDPEQVKREGWREKGLLAVAVDDDRLTWPERELVRQLGEKLYGPRIRVREARELSKSSRFAAGAPGAEGGR